MSHAQNVSLFSFENEVLESSVQVIVKFNADWCGPCRMPGPVLDASRKHSRQGQNEADPIGQPPLSI